MITLSLYDYELDENCYKVRLLLAALDLKYKKISIDMYPGAEHRSPALLALNPVGSLPILVDGEMVLHGAEAIMLYLAHHYDKAAAWLPRAAEAFGQVVMWLQFASVQVAPTVETRRHSLFGADTPDPGLLRQAKCALRIMDDHMTFREFDEKFWFVANGATIADVALFPAIALSRDYGIDHEAYPALRRWMRKVRHLPGFLTMPGVPAYY